MPYNAFGKKVKRRYYVITREDPLSPRPYSTYMTPEELGSFQLDRAQKFWAQETAQWRQEDLSRKYTRYRFAVELI